MVRPELYWLPKNSEFSTLIKSHELNGICSWVELVSLSRLRLDTTETARLDKLMTRTHAVPPIELQTKPVRLAILGSSTLSHLGSSIRVAALRRNLHVTIHEGEYGQYLRELQDVNSSAYGSNPDTILITLDGPQVFAGLAPVANNLETEAALDERLADIVSGWKRARDRGISVIQQTILATAPLVVGQNEHRYAGSHVRLVERFNTRLRDAADQHGVDVVSVDRAAARHGLNAWHDPVLWHRGKYDISPVAAPFYGDLIARLLAARQGRSYKCLVLDLDNTLWGGVIGDDGLEGIALGHGSAQGEAFLAVQRYAKQLAARGIVLAICSKNDETNAKAAFDKHPEMILRRDDIACFIANWDDKATNLRRIARELNIGLDSLVFVDDSAFERGLIRATIPEVAVPEIPYDEPALVPFVLADAGYFETTGVTEEDQSRTASYQTDILRSQLSRNAADFDSYLRTLQMKLVSRPFDIIGLQRIVQLINKSNQFNLTTRRTTESEIRAVMEDPDAFGLQLRLLDRFGDNGIICIAIGRLNTSSGDCVIDTWVMSCRVLGRQVEAATLNLIAKEALARGASRLVGIYRPTAKNGIVADHYTKLGFSAHKNNNNEALLFMLELAEFTPRLGCIDMVEGE